MMGQPGSGKSTFIKNTNFKKPFKVVSRDEIRFSLVDEKEEYFSKENLVFKTFIKEIEDASKSNACVIADATHLNAASRRKLLSNINQSLFSEIDVVWIKTSLEQSIKQNDMRKGTRAFVPKGVIKRMFFQMTPPNFSEGFNKIIEVENGKICIRKKG